MQSTTNPQPMQTGAQQPASGGPPPPAPQMSSPTKEVNTASLCLIGQQTVQDIVNKTQDTFKFLKELQLPNGANISAQLHQDRKSKVEEQLKHLIPQIKKLRIIYNKVLDDTAHFGDQSIEDILPIERDDGTVGGTPQQMNDNVPYATQERQELIEQIQAKNRQLKDIIDKLRLVIWEINTMLDMRKV